VATSSGARTLVLLLTAGLVTGFIASSAGGSSGGAAGRRPPPGSGPGDCSLEFQGNFEGAPGSGITLCSSHDGTLVTFAHGGVPATCRVRQGGVRNAPRDGAIVAEFHVYPGALVGARIRPGGSFGFTARPNRVDLQGGLADHVVTVRGTFYGNNVVGRARARSGKDAFYLGCTGDARFWARRTG